MRLERVEDGVAVVGARPSARDRAWRLGRPSVRRRPGRRPLGVAGVSRDAHGRAAVVWPTYASTARVKLQAKAAVKGGCG